MARTWSSFQFCFVFISGWEMKIGGHSIEISNAEKVFFAEAKITKGDLVDYYRRVASALCLAHH
jgi:hypothetical protein